MKNFVQPGDVLTLTAPAGGVVSGTPVLIGGLLVIPAVTAAAGELFTGHVTGVCDLPKTAAQAWTEGQKLYWDAGTGRADSESTVGPLIGVAAAAAAPPSDVGTVRLNGVAPATAEGPQAAMASLTDRTAGAAADDTLEALTDGATYATDVAAIRNNFAELGSSVNAILDALRAAGVIAR